MIRAFLLIFLFCFSFRTYAQQEAKQHPIDKWFDDCNSEDSNSHTLGMINCAMEAEEKWDAELNKYYKMLMPKLGKEEKEKLKIAQQKWIAYRDSELEFTRTMYGNLVGTMYQVSFAICRMQLTRQRAIEIRTYYEVLEEQ